MEASLKILRNLYKCFDKYNFISYVFFIKSKLSILSGTLFQGFPGVMLVVNKHKFLSQIYHFLLLSFLCYRHQRVYHQLTKLILHFLFFFTSSLSMNTLQCFQHYFDIFLFDFSCISIQYPEQSPNHVFSYKLEIEGVFPSIIFSGRSQWNQ